MDAAVLGDRLLKVTKAFPRPRQPLFAVPALRELESACRVSILLDAVTVPAVCFSGVFRGLLGGGGQQQFATQTLRVHLLGIIRPSAPRSLLGTWLGVPPKSAY